MNNNFKTKDPNRQRVVFDKMLQQPDIQRIIHLKARWINKKQQIE